MNQPQSTAQQQSRLKRSAGTQPPVLGATQYVQLPCTTEMLGCLNWWGCGACGGDCGCAGEGVACSQVVHNGCVQYLEHACPSLHTPTS